LFEIEADGRTWSGLEVHLKQPVGESYEAGTLEVGPVIGDYDGPMDHAGFGRCVEEYYRSVVGSAGRGISVTGGSVRMVNNLFEIPGQCSFTATTRAGGAGW
ncbi:MAG TPA: hypothetical protein VM198_05040, partial [Longimicrobiales bacterium]|nr:hypothetical protein [Longimicrobiales bacterium]